MTEKLKSPDSHPSIHAALALAIALYMPAVAPAQPALGAIWDFENGLGSWLADGLWHSNASSSCGVTDARIGSWTAYFGLEPACDFSTRLRQQGSLTSPAVSIGQGFVLAFDSLRRVEPTVGPWDHTEVAVSAVGSHEWHVLWAKDSTHPSDNSWQTAGPISLAAYAGQSIQVRFSFDSRDNQQNAHLGWKIDNVQIRPSRASGFNQAPNLIIVSPEDGTSGPNVCSTLKGTAVDPDQGDLGAQIQWHSSLDGDLGIGRRLRVTLTPGFHTLTATVTDRGGLIGSGSITYEAVTVAPTEPVTWCGEDR